MINRIRYGILVVGFIFLSALVFAGCGQTPAPTPTPPTPVATTTYAGDASCKACHEGTHTSYQTSKHSTAFKPLSAYPMTAPLGTISVYDALNTENKTPAQLDLSKEGTVLGVMMDDYVVAKVPGFKEKIYRVAAVHKAGDKWEVQPAKEVLDADKKPVLGEDGKPKWSAESYTCGKCHSPGVEANSPSLGVSCESCHGAGSAHVTAANDKKKGSINVPDSEDCLTCHKSDPAKDAKTGVITVNTHYGTRNFSASAHSQSGQLKGCMTCHTVHKANAAGSLLQKDKAADICISCHAEKKYDPAKIMWKNPTDERGHFTADHSFGIKYEDLGDDLATKPVEVTNPATIELLKKAVPDLAK
ncbi:hypothetical protein E4K67_11085 [Desulfosporosinus fructosivorans]|uniref:Doubled CXXCH motif domain-containing protein n=1 Tax=Desulfosporosinus fructosivorans TaxID=2018669 RepID=A0A4Z0R612_9FIRM|nr:cytochrome c3 family protein [Desulfosporosinus fructosivorans]TGE38472.1 hypothetical protein E4K67_11085 [Desulfosporosinus fructosivorans]